MAVTRKDDINIHPNSAVRRLIDLNVLNKDPHWVVVDYLNNLSPVELQKYELNQRIYHYLYPLCPSDMNLALFKDKAMQDKVKWNTMIHLLANDMKNDVSMK